MYIERLAENFVQKAFLIFEILSFEVYCRSDSDSRFEVDTYIYVLFFSVVAYSVKKSLVL